MLEGEEEEQEIENLFEQVIKENTQGANSERKEAGIQINNLEQKGEINSQPEQKQETRIQKNEERLRNLWDNFKHTNPQNPGFQC